YSLSWHTIETSRFCCILSEIHKDVLSVPSYPPLLIRNVDRNMAHAALNAIGSPHGCWADPLQPRALIDIGSTNRQVVHIGSLGFLFSVGNGRFQNLFNILTGALFRNLNNGDGIRNIFYRYDIVLYAEFLIRP